MRCLVISFILAISFHAPALAEEAPQPDEIVVTAHYYAEYAQVSGTALTILTRDEIVESQRITLPDLLAQQIGVQVARNGGIGQPTGLFIRGMPSGHALVMIDGVRINDPSGPNAAANLAGLHVGGMDRIEIARSSNALIWGSNAIGGIVNILPPRMGLEQKRISTEYGSRNTQSSSLFATGRMNRLRYVVSGDLVASDGVATLAGSEGEDLPRSGYQGQNFHLRLDAPITRRLTLVGFLFHRSWNSDYNDFLDPVRKNRSKSRQTVAALQAGTDSHRLILSINSGRRRYDEVFADYAFHGESLTAQYRCNLVRSVVSLSCGAEITLEEISQDGDYGASNHRRTHKSGYAQFRLSPYNRLNISAGIRADSYPGRVHLSWRSDASWRIGLRTTIRASAASGFRAPALADLYGYGGQDDLRPEKSRAYDIGLSHKFVHNRVRLTVGVFAMTVRDQIVYVSCTSKIAKAEMCQTGLYGYLDNLRRTRSHGVEIEAKARFSSSVSMLWMYGYTRARLTAGDYQDKAQARVAPHRARLEIKWKPAGFLTAYCDVQYRSGHWDDYANQVRIEEQMLVGLRARLRVAEGIYIRGRIDNLTDSRKPEVAGYNRPGRSVFAGLQVAF